MIAHCKTAQIHSLKENDMPLLGIPQTCPISACIRLIDSMAIKVDQYAAFIHAYADDATAQAIAYVFANGKPAHAAETGSSVRAQRA